MSATDRDEREHGTAERILSAAERLLIERGSMQAVPVRAIADAVGLAPAALYGHFPDKHALFFGVCARRFEEFAEAVAAAARSADGVIARLEAMGRAYVDYGLRRPEHYQLLFGTEMDLAEEVLESEEPPGLATLELLTATIREGIDQGVLRAVDPETAAVALWAAVHGAVLLASGSTATTAVDMPPSDRLTDATIDTLIEGLRAR